MQAVDDEILFISHNLDWIPYLNYMQKTIYQPKLVLLLYDYCVSLLQTNLALQLSDRCAAGRADIKNMQ